MTPLFKKLNYKSQPHILVLHAPESFDAELQQMAAVTTVHTAANSVAASAFILAFATRQQTINSLAPLVDQLLEGDGILWLCYPKGSSKNYSCDFNRDTGWDALAAYGFEGVRMVAIDADWSALRFRRVQYIKTLTRRFARTAEGQARAARSKNQ